MNKQFWKSRQVSHAGTMTALTVLVLALFYLVNTVLLALSDHYGWYFYTTEQYDLTPGDASDALLSEIDTEQNQIEILFCDTEENISSHRQLDFVYRTAVALRDRHPDLIRISFVNLWLEPSRLDPYRYDEEGEMRTFGSDTVIVDNGGNYLINSPSSFYILDESNYVVAYNGEETLTANILWVTSSRHPVAYFTSNHGEEIPASLYRILTYAGYRVDRLDLSAVAEVPEDAGLVLISAPVYDFQKSAAGSSYVSELNKLASYLAGGGSLYVSLSPEHASRQPNLCAFLSEYGLTAEAGTLNDATNALPGSGGYTLLLEYASEGLGATLGARVSADGRRPVLSQALPLRVGEGTLGRAEPLLQTASGAVILSGSGETVSAGATPVMALSRLKEGGGRILLTGSVYLAADDIINGESYANRELLYALLEELGAGKNPSGIPMVMVDRSAVENLTMGEANLYTFCMAAAIPAVLLCGGLIYCRRRKNH